MRNHDTIKLLILFQYILWMISFVFSYVNYCYDIELFQLFQLFRSNQNNWYNSTTASCSTPCHTVPSTPFAFITYHRTIPMPTSWQTTSCIRRRLPADCSSVLPERGCAGGAEWFQCHEQELQAVLPGYFQWGWRRGLVSCSRAHIEPEKWQTPANLKCNNKYISNNTHKEHNW